MSNDLALARIEAIVSEIERLDTESGGQFRDIYDREAGQIASCIEQKMLVNQGNHPFRPDNDAKIKS